MRASIVPQVWRRVWNEAHSALAWFAVGVTPRIASVGLRPRTIEQWHDALAERLQLSALVGEWPQEDALRARPRERQQLLRATGDLLSVAEAAEVLRCKPQRVYDLRCAGRLPKTTEGGRAVVRRSDIERLIDEVEP